MTIDGAAVRVGDVIEGKLINGVIKPWWAGEEVTDVFHEVIDPTKPPIVWIMFGAFRRGLNVDDQVVVVREDDTKPGPSEASR